MNGLSDELRHHVARLRPDWEVASVSGFIYLEGGYSNDNFRFEYGGERYVLRVPTVPRPFVDRPLEAAVYTRARSAVTPELVAFDAERGHMISRWVPGRLLADLTPDGDELMDYLLELHAALPPIERDYDPVDQARIHLSDAAAPAWLEALAAEMPWSPPVRVPCHNDLNPWNLIRRPDGTWVTLDWEWAGRNDPLFDLVTLHQGAGLEDATLPGLAARYLGEPADPARLTTCLQGFWLREATWALAEIAAGNDRPEILEQRDVGLRKLRPAG